MNVLSDPLGRIWVEDYYRAPQPHGWTVFDVDGKLLGRCEPPNPSYPNRPATLVGFTGDKAVLRWEDDIGARHVSLHSLLASVVK
jgi:hypothetical protein